MPRPDTPTGLPEDFEALKLFLLTEIAEHHHLDVDTLHTNITAPWGWLALGNLASEGLIRFLGRLAVITDDGQMWVDEAARLVGPVPDLPARHDSPDRRDSHRAQLRRAISDPEARQHESWAYVSTGIAMQTLALRQRRGWGQNELARRMGVRQQTISRLENEDDARHTVHTLLKVANAFDVALIVRFAPWSEYVDHASDLPDLAPPEYDKDPGLHP